MGVLPPARFFSFDPLLAFLILARTFLVLTIFLAV